MTRNLAIATIFLLASAFVLGYSWLAERGNMAARAVRSDGQQLTRGARDYEQYCARCHGLTGEGIIGPRINFLYVASKAPDGTTVETGTLIEQDRWNGENQIKVKYGTVRNYVEATITSGVRGAAMPAWSNRVGGPLRDDQIDNIASYILSWQGMIPANAAQQAEAYQATQVASNAAAAAANTPQGRGQALFATCSACHQLSAKEGVGPGLGGLFGPDGTVAFGTNLPNSKPVNVDDWKQWVLNGSGGQSYTDKNGKKWGVMPPFKLQDTQLNDLLSYITQFDHDGKQSLPSLGPDGKPLPAAPAGTPAPGAAPGATPGATANPAVATPKP